MEPAELLRYVVECFEKLNIGYFITGALASIAYGEPRLTNDIDVVVDISERDIARLKGCFPQDEYHFDEDAAFASPEDVILKKMEYYAEGGSEKHLRDISGMIKISAEIIDFAYISFWAGKLGLGEIWKEVEEQVSKKQP